MGRRLVGASFPSRPCLDAALFGVVCFSLPALASHGLFSAG